VARRYRAGRRTSCRRELSIGISWLEVLDRGFRYEGFESENLRRGGGGVEEGLKWKEKGRARRSANSGC
jgi:hypothetical protein